MTAVRPLEETRRARDLGNRRKLRRTEWKNSPPRSLGAAPNRMVFQRRGVDFRYSLRVAESGNWARRRDWKTRPDARVECPARIMIPKEIFLLTGDFRERVR